MRHLLTTTLLTLSLATPAAAFAFAGDFGSLDVETVPDVAKAYKKHAAKQAAKKKAAQKKKQKAKKSTADKASKKPSTEG